MSQRLTLPIVAVLVLAACAGGGSAAPGAAPAASAERVVQDFMRAVADSNLTKMAQLWGSAKGSAGATHEPGLSEAKPIKAVGCETQLIRFCGYRREVDVPEHLDRSAARIRTEQKLYRLSIS